MHAIQGVWCEHTLSRSRWCVCGEWSERSTEKAHSKLAQATESGDIVRGGMASSHGKNEHRFADWMANLPESMHSIPLTNLAIPGKSHIVVCTVACVEMLETFC